MNREQVEEIFSALNGLPSEKVTEVKDFVLFLKEQYGFCKTVHEGDSWSQEDIDDLTKAVLNYADADERQP
ncbi:MAG: hypothetical protein M1470_13650 [Bacteroidetes bacterium]|nr:hypothetical protein [Bacteroidota bacterium]MCL5738464.1 hypothetical protein [Bacteroidota bacterium]